jgi:hypothetical protein
MPAANWIFVDWTENGTQVSVDPEYTFTVTGNRELTANFVETFLITATANPTEGGYIQGEGTYPAGSLVILQAYANSDFSFYAWTENGVPVSSSASYTFTASANRNLVAGFLPTVNVEETAGGISIYPNPVSGTLYLRTSPGASSGIKTVWLSDPEGRCVFERTTGGSSHEMTVDVSPFAPGFYLVRIMLVDGTMTNARVVVVK